MKKGIHPNFQIVEFTDISSGKKFKIGSTTKDMTVEISSASHPFYTNVIRELDMENRMDSFRKRAKEAVKLQTQVAKKKEKLEVRRNSSRVKRVSSNAPLTLRDMLKNAA